MIHDTDDDEVPAIDTEHIAKQWSGTRFVRTEGLGHRRVLRDGHVRALVVEAVSGRWTRG